MPLNYQCRRHHHHCFQHHHHPYHHHSTSYHHPQRVKMTRWGLSHPLPPATPATSTPNESFRLVGGPLSPTTCDAGHINPSTCDASHSNPQRVILTRWGLSLPLHLRRRPHQPSTSHYDSLGALSPPSTCDASHINPQRVILT